MKSKSWEERDDGHIYADGDNVALVDAEHVAAPATIAPLAPGGEDFPEGSPANIKLDCPAFLKMNEGDDLENWQASKMSSELSAMRSIDIKRQEHMYEFIVSEANHCQVLNSIYKIYMEGMEQSLNLAKEVIDRMFPCIELLLKIHMSFLGKLRMRQNEASVIETIEDLITEQFSGENAYLWKQAYTTFCAQHTNAVNLYKDLEKSDRRFASFIRQASNNPLLKVSH